MVQESHRIRSRIAIVFLVSASLLLSGFATDHARAGQVAEDRSVMLQLTNESREDRNREALELNRRLSRYAVRHSRAMANRGELFHTEDLAALLQGLDWHVGGENVGVGDSLDGLQATFMESRPHRQNILCDDFDHTAIGVVQSDGSFWVTVIFYG
jgi:uncharacterized protein YkwD